MDAQKYPVKLPCLHIQKTFKLLVLSSNPDETIFIFILFSPIFIIEYQDPIFRSFLLGSDSIFQPKISFFHDKALFSLDIKTIHEIQFFHLTIFKNYKQDDFFEVIFSFFQEYSTIYEKCYINLKVLGSSRARKIFFKRFLLYKIKPIVVRTI